MCLVAVAHRASDRFPLVLAANRDEDYGRATHAPRFWDDAPTVLGGRDALHGGSWLAVTRSGRFAAVTNLRGAAPAARSRGLLVLDFVTGTSAPRAHAAAASAGSGYAAFHLLAGVAGDELWYAARGVARALPAGVHAFSNAPDGVAWPKMIVAAAAVDDAVRSGADAVELSETLLVLLSAPRGTGSVEEELFVAGERYGTRSSTVIVASRDEILFVEQAYVRGGGRAGPPRSFRFAREAAAHRTDP